MQEIPEELIREILLRLPAESLARFKRVSKTWCSIINDPQFIRHHLAIRPNPALLVSNCDVCQANPIEIFNITLNNDNDITDDQPLIGMANPLRSKRRPTRIIGSCNGLVLLYTTSTDIALWNPSTKYRKTVPPSTTKILPFSARYCAYGFGYDPIQQDYKVMRMLQFSHVNRNRLTYEGKIYSFKSKLWRKIQYYPFEDYMFHEIWGKYSNGGLHWLNIDRRNRAEILVSFHLGTEEFGILPLPSFRRTDDVHYSLDVLDGYLCMHMFYKTKLEIWIMKEYGVKESWSKHIVIEQTDWFLSTVRPLLHSRNGEEVLLEQNYEKLVWYNLKTRKTRRVYIPNMPKLFVAEAYVPSLVRL